MHRHITEVAAFDADKGEFVVFEPGDIVARADVDVVGGDLFVAHFDLRSDGAGFGEFFGGKSFAF